MTIKEITKILEDRVEVLTSTVGFGKDNPQKAAFREQLLAEVAEILEKKLTEQVAYRVARRVLDAVRQDLRQRQKEAATVKSSTPQPSPTV
jgi:hypothetical protein